MTSDRQRLDKWLWFARAAKTRTLAAKLVTSGAVRINRLRVEAPSHPVKVGDVLTIALRSGVAVWRVCDLGERRGPAVVARRLYEDLAQLDNLAQPGTAPLRNDPR